jgi:hypothetical protein
VNSDRSESIFNIFDENDLENLTEGADILWVEAGEVEENELQERITSTGFGREIWSWFMIAGLFLLVMESVVSRWYKAESLS